MSSGSTTMEVAPVGRMLLYETRARIVGRLRNPAFAVLSMGLPVMFFALFNAIFGSQRAAPGVSVAEAIMVSYATYAVGNVMVYNFGIGLAADRGRKLDLLQRATPLPPLIAAVAQVIFAITFALVALLILFAYAYVVGGVRLGAGTWLDLVWRLLIGSFPLIGLGMAIGYGVGPNAAPALANVIYLPMLFLSGVFVPVDQLPEGIRRVGELLPTYHYVQLASGTLGINKEGILTALAWLAAWTVVLLAITVRLYRVDESKKFS